MDPVFVKAHKLLFSNEPDSAEQLRGLLDQALKQRYGNAVSLSAVLPTTLATPTETDVGPKPTPQNLNEGRGDESEESNEGLEITTEEQLALDLLQEEIKCVVCKEMTTGPKNVLVECVECHSLYHQECHQPAVSDADSSDPRLAWYCAACKKKMDKTLATMKSTTAASSTSKSAVGSSSKGSSKKSSSASSVPNSSSSSSENSTKSLTRSAKTAAGKTVTPVFTIITADQRLQQMKKKAAAGKKAHDKGKREK